MVLYWNTGLVTCEPESGDNCEQVSPLSGVYSVYKDSFISQYVCLLKRIAIPVHL